MHQCRPDMTPMTARTCYAPLTASDIEALVPVLHDAQVYAFLGGLPTRDDFILGLRRAIAGPPATSAGEHWINYGVRLAGTGELIGRVQATVHGDLAEVAFLYSPSAWGRGYATEGLLWLHEHLRRYAHVSTFWATTQPGNLRSGALLRRAGYARAAIQGLPMLYSYDEGDLVFHRSAG
jgi:RimJ/RimL family protein N-acetyltransferase